MGGVLDPALLDELPIFPLPDTVLFPGSILPLHVFEPRYRAMTADVIAGRGHLAIARLKPGYEASYHQRPAVYPIIGLGELVAHDLLPDGRYNLLVAGVARLEIERELPPVQSYRQVVAKVLDDKRCARPDELAASHARLVAVCDRLADLLPEGGRELRQLTRAMDGHAASADLIASALLADADHRQHLLELLDPADRLDAMLEHVSEILVALERKPPGPLN
jgi:Lon protease-like protein